MGAAGRALRDTWRSGEDEAPAAVPAPAPAPERERAVERSLTTAALL